MSMSMSVTLPLPMSISLPLPLPLPMSVTLADEVVLLGSPARSEPDSRYWGAVTDTIAHEILTGLGGRAATCQTDQTQGTNL